MHFRAMDLLDALRRPEGKTLEFKRDLSSPEGLLRTVVAFANTASRASLNLGRFVSQRGEKAEAIRHYCRAFDHF